MGVYQYLLPFFCQWLQKIKWVKQVITRFYLDFANIANYLLYCLPTVISAFIGLICFNLILVVGLLWVLIAIAIVAYRLNDGESQD